MADFIESYCEFSRSTGPCNPSHGSGVRSSGGFLFSADFPVRGRECRGCSGALGFLDVAYLSLIVGIVDGLDEVRDDFP